MEIRLLASTVDSEYRNSNGCVLRTRRRELFMIHVLDYSLELVQYIKVDRYVREPERPRFYLSARSEI